MCVACYQRTLVSIHYFIHVWMSLCLTEPLTFFSLSLPRLSILWAEADRADVDNYKVFLPNAPTLEMSDSCSLLLTPFSFLLLSCGPIPSGATTAPQTLNTISQHVCVCVCVCLYFFFPTLLSFSVFLIAAHLIHIFFGPHPLFFFLLIPKLTCPRLCSHTATFGMCKPMFGQRLAFQLQPPPTLPSCAASEFDPVRHRLSHLPDHSVW